MVWCGAVWCGAMWCGVVKGKGGEQTGCGILRVWGVHLVVGGKGGGKG